MNFKKLNTFFLTDTEYLIKNGSWIYLSQGINIILALSSAYVFSNFIEPEAYGTYKYILSIFGLLALSTLNGMETAVLEGVATKESGAYLSALRTRMRWGLIGMGISIIIGMYYFLHDNYIFGTVFTVGSISIPFFSSLTLWKSLLAGKKLFKPSSLYNMLIQVSTITGTISILLLTRNIYFTLLLYITVNILSNVLTHIHIQAKHPEATENNNAQKTLLFGKRLSAANLFSTGIDRADAIIVWHFLGPTALAYYAFTIAITTPAKTLLKTFFNLAQPIFVGKETYHLKTSIRRKVFQSFFITIPVTALYIATLPFVYEILFPNYIESVKYAQALGILFVLYPLKLYSIALLTRKNKNPIYFSNIIIPLIHIVLLLVLLPIFGIWGAISTLIIDFIISTLITYFFFKKSH